MTAHLHSVGYPADRPTLLLLHGVARNRRDWDTLIVELAADWRSVALDHRGHGGSERVPGEYLVADYCRDAVAFVRANFAEPVAVMGHSLGAMVALAVAAECGPLVERVILEDPPFHTMGRAIGSTPYRAQFAGMREVARRGGEVEAMTDALAEIRIPTAEGTIRLGDVRDRASLTFLAECLMQVDPEVFDPLVAGRWLDGYDHEALWPRVGCPTLLLQGDPAAGGLFSDGDVEVAKRGLHLHRHIHFEGIGHPIHRTAPKEVAAAVGEFAQWGG